jgi:hypothetical protein
MSAQHPKSSADRARDAILLARRVTCALILIAVVPSAALGQGSVIGQIQRIRNTGGQQSCRPQAPLPGSVRLVRARTPRDLREVPPPEPLQLNDSVRVGGDFDARITINDTTFGVGEIVLAPRLFCAVIGADLRRGLASDTGIYSLSRRGDSLRFAVHRGGAYITWTDRRRLCRLQVIAADPRNPLTVCGTTLIVAVDSSGRRGVMHLVEGSVRLGALAVQAGDVVTLGVGEPPTILPRAQSTALIDRRHVDFHSNVVWQGGPEFPPPREPSGLARLLRNPWTYVGLVGAGAGAWCAIERCWESQSTPAARRTRTIIVNIPL